MIEVYYCCPSDFAETSYGTGSRRFRNSAEAMQWIAEQTEKYKKPLLITAVKKERGEQ